MLTRDVAEAVFAAAIEACDPMDIVSAARSQLGPGFGALGGGAVAEQAIDPGRVLGLAAGKAALAMARGAGPVSKGLAIAPAEDGFALPAGWETIISSHPVPDERSLVAGERALALFAEATAADTVIALISGGASSLMEAPRIPFDAFRAITSAVMASGAPIATLNLVRSALSRIKAGGLVAGCAARVLTFVISDVIGDFVSVIGSGPTIPTFEPLAEQASAALANLGLHYPELEALVAAPPPPQRPRIGDIVRLIAPLRELADVTADELERRGFSVVRSTEPLVGDVEAAAVQLSAPAGGIRIAWGEPTLTVLPDHGEGGRMQQLALLLAKLFRGSKCSALCAGSDGMDGPPPANRAAPAGAFIDGTTWDAIVAAGLDPEAALARRDAGTVLDAVGALVITGPTGINHADLVLIG